MTSHVPGAVAHRHTISFGEKNYHWKEFLRRRLGTDSDLPCFCPHPNVCGAGHVEHDMRPASQESCKLGDLMRLWIERGPVSITSILCHKEAVYNPTLMLNWVKKKCVLKWFSSER